MFQMSPKEEPGRRSLGGVGRACSQSSRQRLLFAPSLGFTQQHLGKPSQTMGSISIGCVSRGEPSNRSSPPCLTSMPPSASSSSWHPSSLASTQSSGPCGRHLFSTPGHFHVTLQHGSFPHIPQNRDTAQIDARTSGRHTSITGLCGWGWERHKEGRKLVKTQQGQEHCHTHKHIA